MLAIKLQRIGRKHQPSYRVVVAERRTKLGSRPVEDLGFYNPFSKAFQVKGDRVQYWMGVGAAPTVTAHNLLVKNGIIEGTKIKIGMPRPKAKEEAPAEVAAEVAEPTEEAVEEVAAEEPAQEEVAEEAPAEEPAAEEA